MVIRGNQTDVQEDVDELITDKRKGKVSELCDYPVGFQNAM